MIKRKDQIAPGFEHVFTIISSEDFLKMRALGGELPFFIQTFDPSIQNEIEKAIASLINKLENNGIRILEINLYDLCLEILEEEGRLKQILEQEQKMPKERLLKALQSSLNIELRIMPAVKKKIDANEHRVMFMTGIGLVFPYIRSHTILNNLQKIAKTRPTLILFPGKYNNQALELFELLKDDNYYRAFNIEQNRI